MKNESIGIVETKYHSLSDDLILESGEKLKNPQIAY